MRAQNGDSFSSTAEAWPLALTINLPMHRIDTARPKQNHRAALLHAFLVCAGLLLSLGTMVFAVPMQNDPNGFEGIPWGAGFSGTADFKLVDDGPTLTRYTLLHR